MDSSRSDLPNRVMDIMIFLMTQTAGFYAGCLLFLF